MDQNCFVETWELHHWDFILSHFGGESERVIKEINTLRPQLYTTYWRERSSDLLKDPKWMTFNA